MWPFSALRCERGGSRGLGSVVGGNSALKTPPPLPETWLFYLYCCVALMLPGISCSVYLYVYEHLQNQTKDRVIYTLVRVIRTVATLTVLSGNCE